jgi:hypothetical protein
MDVSVFWVLCVVTERSLRQADHSSRRTVMCDTSWMRGPWPTGGSCAKKRPTNLNAGRNFLYFILVYRVSQISVQENACINRNNDLTLRLQDLEAMLRFWLGNIIWWPSFWRFNFNWNRGLGISICYKWKYFSIQCFPNSETAFLSKGSQDLLVCPPCKSDT